MALSVTTVQGVCLGGAQETDMKAFSRLWQQGDWRKINHVVADKGYDFAAVRIFTREACDSPTQKCVYPGGSR